MNELMQNKQKIIINTVALLVFSVISIVLIIGASPGFKSSGYGIALLILFLIMIPLILSIGFLGIRSISSYVEYEEKQRTSTPDAMEKLEKEVEEKAKEADDLSFNLHRLGEDMGAAEDWKTFAESLLKAFSNQIEIVVGIVYYLDTKNQTFKPIAEYAYFANEKPHEYKIGDGLTGQVIKDKKAMFIDDLPEGYVKVVSGLGSHKPNHLAIIPLIDQTDVVGVLEIATFKPLERGLSRRIHDISTFIGKKASKLG